MESETRHAISTIHGRHGGVTLDANGRFLLPRKMAEVCHINSRIVRFVGVDDRIEVWDVEQFDQCMLNDADLAQLMAQEMVGTTLG